jgi:hypothetical protein
MMATALACETDERRIAVRANPNATGLDYLEVSDDGLTITVYCLGPAPSPLLPANISIAGGRRIRDVHVTRVTIQRATDPEPDDRITIELARAGDFSTYTLALVEMDAAGRPTTQPLPSLDPRYASLDFTFHAGCASDLDCKQDAICPTTPPAQPEINYLAKDYASFRQLILDRLAVIMPAWHETHAPDVGLALVELLAYVGDELSYYQDAVATEAYLQTAKHRISVRRHARLVDYLMHEGCNARAWLCIRTDSDLVDVPPSEVFFVTSFESALPAGIVLTTVQLGTIPASTYEVFEPVLLDGQTSASAYAANSTIPFYTWGDAQCCLPAGATGATLKDAWVSGSATEQTHGSGATGSGQRALHLRRGDVLVFMEVKGPITGDPADADPTRRWAVRLIQVEQEIDPLNGQPIVNVAWNAADALPFAICVSSVGQPPECQPIADVSVACGNVWLVDNGRTTDGPEDLGTVPTIEVVGSCDRGCPTEEEADPGPFRPVLAGAPLTYAESPGANASSSSLLRQDPHKALPQLRLTSTQTRSDGTTETSDWVSRYDLLESGSRDRHVVVETDNTGTTHLRFGDGESGAAPGAAAKFSASYRVGNGRAGNVGAETITRMVRRGGSSSGGNLEIFNPMPAVGGTDPEPISEVKVFAPTAFRDVRERAIIANDYARLAERDSRLQRASARLRWTGSWFEATVAIDPVGIEDAGVGLLTAVDSDLNPYRRLGHDLRVEGARYVALEIGLQVCVKPTYFRGHVKAALLEVFSNRLLAGGGKGFFHPDNLTFGDGVFASKLIATAQAVDGVESVRVTQLQRYAEGPRGELANGYLALTGGEVPQLDNDPSFPEHGVFRLDMRGGR